MGAFVAQEIIQLMLRDGKIRFDGGKPTVTVLGLTFKENVSDLRNSKVIDIIHELNRFGIDVQVADPLCYPDEAEHEYGLKLVPFEMLKPTPGVILAVAHDAFKSGGWPMIQKLLVGGSGVVADLKHLLPREQKPAGIELWRL